MAFGKRKKTKRRPGRAIRPQAPSRCRPGRTRTPRRATTSRARSTSRISTIPTVAAVGAAGPRFGARSRCPSRAGPGRGERGRRAERRVGGTPNGRFTIAAYAAPKSAGLWREVAAELADALRKDTAEGGHRERAVGPRGGGRRRGRGALHRRRRVSLDDPLRGQRPAANASSRLPSRRETRWRTPSSGAVTPRFRCARRCPVQLPEPMAAQLRAAAATGGQQAAGAAGWRTAPASGAAGRPRRAPQRPERRQCSSCARRSGG